MLWNHYVFRRGTDVHNVWDDLYSRKPVRLLYIAGRGFDVRAKTVLSSFVQNLKSAGHVVEKAELLLVGIKGYHLPQELHDLTSDNARELTSIFGEIGVAIDEYIDVPPDGEEDLSPNNLLRIGTQKVLSHLSGHNHIILEISSLPRTIFLSLLTSILGRLIPKKAAPNALYANGVNFQVLVAEDAKLDSVITSEDPSNDLVHIPGYSSVLHAESMRDWPLVWFPILGERRVPHFEQIMTSVIPDSAEICPVLPHPAVDPRRGDRLLVEYMVPLFDRSKIPTSNILHAHESHPFEAYRQLLLAMQRYKESLSILGGCRIVVTPLGSKLITVGAGLACFDIKPTDTNAKYGVAIPYAESKRYHASIPKIKNSEAELAMLLLTGDAYKNPPQE